MVSLESYAIQTLAWMTLPVDHTVSHKPLFTIALINSLTRTFSWTFIMFLFCASNPCSLPNLNLSSGLAWYNKTLYHPVHAAAVSYYFYLTNHVFLLLSPLVPNNVSFTALILLAFASSFLCSVNLCNVVRSWSLIWLYICCEFLVYYHLQRYNVDSYS